MKKRETPAIAQVKVRHDPPDFVETCLLLFNIQIGDSAFPMDVAALDTWVAEHASPESTAVYERKRRGVVSSFAANDMEATGYALEDLHQFIHLLRAVPNATAGARARRNQRERAKKPHKLTLQNKANIVRRYRARVTEGRKYGALKELARDYGVSEWTIKDTLKKA